MMIDAKNMPAKELCEIVKHEAGKALVLDNVNGQRYIAAGLGSKSITINGTAGNALGAYLDGAKITVNGNAQDACGDTMNDGAIIINGSSGDATGYAMRGGRIYVKDDAGYRAGIHMKAYKEKQPVLIVGGKVGSFLGEYQAGGIIIVLGLDGDGEKAPVGRFVGTGMHGGKMFLRCKELPDDLPAQIIPHKATAADMDYIDKYLTEYCEAFGVERDNLKQNDFFVLEPDTKNPYKQLYCYS
ncbi:MAG: glutamate synthase [Clostridia bacterium]|nr:glutamate synthase [Clostridia bacterium]NLS86049.1 glutamate synthase [Oscillospiraceae bacterium]